MEHRDRFGVSWSSALRHTLVDALVDRALREPLISGGSRRGERKEENLISLAAQGVESFSAAKCKIDKPLTGLADFFFFPLHSI